MRNANSAIFSGVIGLVLATTGLQALEFHPIADVQSSTAANDLWPASNLIQGPGVGFDANSPNDKLVGGAAGNWVTDAPGGFPSDYITAAGSPVLVFDLGQDQSLSEISVWGYASSNANGVSEFSLLFATDSDGLGGFGSSVSYNPVFGGLTNDDTARQSFSFQQTTMARYVQFTALDNFFVAPGDGSGGETPGGDRVGLGEVAFLKSSVSVPESASTLMLFGLAGLGLLGFTRLAKRDEVRRAN